MIDLNSINEIIIQEKNYLKNKSKNYVENFLEIEKFITDEIINIEELNKKNENIIPEVKFDDLKLNLEDLTLEVKKRGCVVIRDVFDDDLITQMNKDLEQYIEENNYYEDQKKKADIDKYFSDLKSGKPQIFGLYWSKPQVNIRQSIESEVAKAKRIIEELDKAAKEGKGAAQLDGRMIDAASARMAENIVNIDKLIHNK